MFSHSSCVFCLRSPWKRLYLQVVALFDWMNSHPPSIQLSLLNWTNFDVSNGGQSFREFVAQKVGPLVKVVA